MAADDEKTGSTAAELMPELAVLSLNTERFVGLLSKLIAETPVGIRAIQAAIRREREGERDRKKEKQRETERDRKGERKRERERETETERDRERQKEREREKERENKVTPALLCK